MRLLIMYLCLFLHFANGVNAQSDTICLSDITNRLQNYYQQNPIEKLYIHHDRHIYCPGDTIWFKVYQMICPIKQKGSGSVYIDLLNINGEIVTSSKWPLNKGTSSGNIDIPIQLKSGTYWLCGYTNYMKNYSDNGKFIRPIRIIGFNQTTQKPIKRNKNIHLSFYPEGGDLVETLPSKVAFKVTDATGKGISARGVIKNKKDSIIQTFKTTHLGQGFFYLLPEAKEKYTAYLLDYDISELLPNVLPSGIAMDVKVRTDRLRINLAHHQKQSYKPSEIYIMIHQENKITAFVPVYFQENRFVADISVDRLPEGVFNITILDLNYNVYCERLAIVKQPPKLPIKVQTESKYFDSSSGITIQMQVGDKTTGNNSGSFSLSIVNKMFYDISTHNNLYTYSFLTSKLRGQVESLASYFKEDSLKVTEVNLLLMIQGWRRYSWKDIFDDDQPKKQTYLMENGLSISGKVSPFSSKMIKEGVSLHAILQQDSLRKNYLYPINNDGSFYISDLSFIGPASLLLFANNKNQPLKVTLNELPVSTIHIPTSRINEKEDTISITYHATQTQRVQRDIEKQIFELGEIEVTAKKKAKEYDRPYNINFIHGAYVLDPNQSYGGTVLQLFNHIPGLQLVPVRGAEYKQAVRITGHTASYAPILVVDGFVTRNPDLVYDMPAALIERVEILKGPNALIYDSYGALGGAIVLYTRKFDPKLIKSNHVAVCNLLGYNQQKEFYKPTGAIDRTDSTATIYWHPFIKTDKNGKAFLTLDIPALNNSVIHIEGITENGIVGSREITVTAP